MELIKKSAVVAEIERLIERAKAERVLYPKTILAAKNYLLIEDYNKLLSFLDSLKVKEVDVEKESELIANGIMISVQANKYGTNIYNTERNDYNHYHLQMAARKGIELGLKAVRKGE